MNCYQNGHSSAIFIKKKCTSLQNITLLSQTTFHLQVAKHYVIKLVGDLLQFGGFFHHDITEILLKVALNTIKPTKPNPNKIGCLLHLYFFFF
jgi:hypothetical protein